MNWRVAALSVLAAGFVAGVFIAVDRFVAPAPDGQTTGAPAVRNAAAPPDKAAKPAAEPQMLAAPAVRFAPPKPRVPPAPAEQASTAPEPQVNLPPEPAPAKPADSNTPAKPSTVATPVEPVVTAPPENKASTADATPPVAEKPVAPVASAPTVNEPAASKPPAPTAEPKPKKEELASLPPASKPEPETKPEPAPPPVAMVPAPMPPEKPDIPEKEKDKGVAAKFLFASEKLPSTGRARAIGYYPKGCLSGGVELPINGPTWQAMRLSRNRNWGHPSLVRFVERFAKLAAKATGWPGILVGDLGQPRGGPLPFGHKSHQVGLDVDVWFMPMPDHRLTKKEREKISASNLVASDWKRLNPKTWTPAHADFIRVAAEQPEVERVLVNAAIKKELCRLEGKQNWSWLSKVRPWYGHHDHIHVRLKCPPDSPHCRHQPPVPGGDGCGSELAYWFSDKVLHPKREKPKPGVKVKPKPKKELMMADLPAACRQVLDAPAKNSNVASDGRR